MGSKEDRILNVRSVVRSSNLVARKKSFDAGGREGVVGSADEVENTAV